VPQLLLHRFRELFEGRKYIHRDSTLGDSVAKCLSEDLFTLARSQKLVDRIQAGKSMRRTFAKGLRLVGAMGPLANSSRAWKPFETQASKWRVVP
jgi:hypothetical protein